MEGLTGCEKRLEDLLNHQKFTTLKQLYAEQESLNYQHEHLNKTIANMHDSSENHSISMQMAVEALLDYAIKIGLPETSGHKVQINTPTKDVFGDFQCNSALRISKELENNGVNKPANMVANSIISSIPKNDVIDKVELAGKGFINVWISKNFITKALKKIVTKGILPPRIERRGRVTIDMSSPNIAKEMHVGHLRSTIIGDSIARLLVFLGHDVVKVNHIGDWGTQFGMLIAHLQELFPDSDSSPPIQDLQAFYKAAKARFDTEEDFKLRAYAAVVQLQSNNPKHINSWKQICEISRCEFQKIYNRLDIRDLIERGESFYQSRMCDLVKDLKSQGLLTSDEGRLLLWPPGCEIPLTIVKSDGGYTYDTSDMAALLQRFQEEKADWVLYVVDLGQGVHFKTIFAGAELAGFYRRGIQRVEHIGFGVVLGDDKKKFKTRSGETVRLMDLLDEGLDRSRKRLIEKGRDKELSDAEFKAAQEAIAYSCIKYADLSHSRTLDYVFSFEKMLDDRGNTAVYLLYAYTRIRSIIRNSNLTSELLAQKAETEPIILEHPTEWKLAKAICRLPDILIRLQNEFMLHQLCDYIYDLSCTFTSFYDACYCIERDRETGDVLHVNTSRLMLCEATAKVMKCAFDILGLQTVERM